MKRILFADDDKDVRDMMQRSLPRMGYEVATAGNSREAITLLEQGDFDLILSDKDMPETDDGIRLLEWVRQSARHKDTLFTLQTGADDDDGAIARRVQELDGEFRPKIMVGRKESIWDHFDRRLK
jgi:CheY-like chemotaxis protein